jgi:hypothetical protein
MASSSFLLSFLMLSQKNRSTRAFGNVISDELRRINDNILRGQGHLKLPWGKQYSLQGYFVLCASAKLEHF